MVILTADEIKEETSFPVTVGFVGYEDEETGYLGAFPTAFESKAESAIDGDAVLVYTIEYRGQYYYKFVSAADNAGLGPLYVPFIEQNSRSLDFGIEMKEMRAFKKRYISFFDELFHNPNARLSKGIPPDSVATSLDEIYDNEGVPSDN